MHPLANITLTQKVLAIQILQMSFIKQFKQSLFRAGPFVFICLILSTLLEQWITQNLHQILMSQDGIGPELWVLGLISMANSLIFPIFSTIAIILSQNEAEFSLVNIFTEMNQVLIESLRAWGKSLAWGFLLILPGIVKWLRYSFVPFVVLLDEEYRQGKKDALEKSEDLAHKRFFAIFALFFIFALLIPFIMAGFDEYKTILKTPLSALFLLLFDTIFLITFVLLLRKIYLSPARSS